MKRFIFIILTFIFAQTSFMVAVDNACADNSRWLGREQIILYGLGLRAEPAHQTVPKDIATIVSTWLQAPDAIPAGVQPVPTDAEVRATLRGPSLPDPVELVTGVNGQFDIPPLHLAGVHTLENIRIVHNGEIILRATPESVSIEVIDRLLVTEVTARPLSADEIKDKGIVFDSSNFQAYNFTTAFAVAPGKDIRIDFPVLLPTLARVESVGVPETGIPSLKTQLKNIKTIIPDTLKIAQTQIPNLMVKGFSFTIVGEKMGVLEAPPIPGVIVIPGDIGFLNQYFSVMLMVGNAAPEGSGLVVQDIQAEISLPAGDDTVVGSGDDPLAMAVTQQGDSPGTRPVVKPGPDGKTGTADDENFIAPGETGNAEFLVEGRREGTHVVEMEISGTLTGLPVGPVEIRGRAAGAVLVRNPAFTVTFTHPEIVNAGESYDLDVTVTNTSQSPANFVSVNLYPRNISGATLEGEQTQEVETIPAGDSAVVSFRLRSRVTGSVFAATLDSDDKVAGRFELKTSVGELGIPLSPDSLVLPKEAGSLPEGLRKAGVALLGKAYAAATAPAGALPKEVKRFTRNMVWDRAVEMARAGLRYTLHEPLVSTVKHLLMDFAGNNYARLADKYPEPDDADDLEAAQNDFSGFDDLRRRSFRGDVFADEIAAILTPDLTGLGVAGFHAGFAEAVSFRPQHLSVLIGTDGDPLPFRLILADDQGNTLGEYNAENDKVIKDIPFSDYLAFKDTGENTLAQMALVASPQGTGYTIRLEQNPDAPQGTPFTLSIVLPADTLSGLRQVVFSGMTGDNGIPVIEPVAGDPVTITVEMVDQGEPLAGPPMQPTSTAAVTDPAPAVISVVQMADADVIKCEGTVLRVGRVAAALFSEAVTPESVQNQADRMDISNYEPENNEVVGVALQPGGRIAYLALQDPVGPFVERQIRILDAEDLRGQHMPAPWTGSVEATITDEPYGVISGKVLHADGTPVPYADIRLFTYFCKGYTGISAKTADADGNYTWDFVFYSSKVIALDPESGRPVEIPFRVQRHGQRIHLNIVFPGRGTLKGRAFSEDGYTPLPDTHIKVTSLSDYSEYGITTDEEGRYDIPSIPVGSILIEAVNIQHEGGQILSQSKITVSDVIPEAGGVLERDLVLLNEETGQTAIDYGSLSGFVLESDGSTPVAGVPVVVYHLSGSQEGLICPYTTIKGDCPVAMGKTGDDGSFSFDDIPAGRLRIYTFDPSRLLEGEAWITLEADAESHVNILLSGGLGTVTGVVLDADGNPVPNATVGGGMSLTTTDENGRFVMTDVPVGRRQIVAVSQEVGSNGSAIIDLAAEGAEAGATIVLDGVGSVAGTIYDTDGITPVPNQHVYLFYPVKDSINVVGTAVTDANGHYRMDKIPLRHESDYTLSAFRPDFSAGDTRPVPVRFHGQSVTADITFRGSGRVTGHVFDDDGVTPLAAKVSISGLRVTRAGPVGVGFEYIPHVEIKDNDFSTGAFSFNNVFMGNFVVTAVGPFSPDPIAASAIMPADGATVDVSLQLQPTGQITGTVYESDGETPAGQDMVVTFRGYKLVFNPNTGEWEEQPNGIQEEIVTTDEDGRFQLPLVNAGRYAITVRDPATGKVGQVRGMIRAGQTDDVSIRLLGLGDVTVHVLSSQGDPVPGAVVEIQQSNIEDIESHGTSDGAGEISFTMPEGEFTVLARNLQNGFAGRAPGEVTEDGEQVSVNVYLWDTTGTVSGTIFSPDGITPVSNAQIMISTTQDLLGMVVTDDDGRYSMGTIPLGDFNVRAYDPATGRTGIEQGRIDLNGQEVPVNITLFPVGYVTGTVLSSVDHSPVQGYRVMITQPDPLGRINPLLYPNAKLAWFATTGPDGGFAFPGIQLGTFDVTVGPRGLGSISSSIFLETARQTKVEGRITHEGEQVDIPVIVDLSEPPEGRIMGWVYNPDGTPAPDCQITGPLGPKTTDADGAFEYEHVPFGRYAIQAQSQVTDDKGYAWTDVASAGQTTYVRIVLKGLGNITGTVVDDTGDPAAGARVMCTIGGIESFTVFADPQGQFLFSNVSPGKFTVLAEDIVHHVSGSTGGVLTPSGTADVRVVLEPTESVTGVAVFSDQRPAPGVAVQLAGADTTLYGETGSDGRFSFAAVPVGSWALTLDDPVGVGLATMTVNVVDTALDLGSIVLDDTLPAVVATDPTAGAIHVPLDPVIHMTFSKPINPGTVNADSITLTRNDGEKVTGILTVESGDTSVTFTPLSPLDDEARYTLTISAAPPFDELDLDHNNSISQDEAVHYFPLVMKFDEYDTNGDNILSWDEYPHSVADRLGRVMKQAYVASFSTVDITPPAVLDVSPAPSTGGVSVDSVIRVTYSEPVNPDAFSGNALQIATGQTPVAGRVDMILGNTGIVFTPDIPLAQDTVYQVTVLPATDLSGNTQAGGLSYEFSTTDSTPPVVQELILSGNGAVVQDGVGTVSVNTGSEFDVSFVDFFINGTLAFTDRQPPFEMNFEAISEFGGPGDSITVSAVATDTSGNRGTPVDAVFTIIADTAPSVTVSSVSTGTQATTGQRVEITVHAEDDLGLTSVAFQAVGGESPSFGSVSVDPPTTSADQGFAFYVPVDAVPGSTITVRATTVDTRGQSGEAAPVSITVLDATDPVVGFAGISSGDQVRPGQVITTVVSAQDLGGISSVSFHASGAATFSETRDVSPALDSMAATFTFTVPASATPPGTIVLEATAVDQAGNSAQAPAVVLTVADDTPPVIVTFTTGTGSLFMVPGGTVTLHIAAEDEVGVSRIDISGTGAFTYSDSEPVSPPVREAGADFTLNIPASLATGDTIDLEATAADMAGNVSTPSTLTLSVTGVPDVTLPASVIMLAGDTQEITLEISDPAPAGGLDVDLESEDPGIATVSASVHLDAGQTSGTFSVSAVSGGNTTVNSSIRGFLRSSMTVAVEGGVVSGTVYDPSMTPVAGASVKVNYSDGTVTDSNGNFLVTGVNSSSARIQVSDPDTGLKGYYFGLMNVSNGFLRDVDIVLAEAGSLVGTAVLPDGQTPAGQGVRVDLFKADDLDHVIDSVFTDADGRFEFPIVTLGDYVVETSDTGGNRGRMAVTLSEGGREISITVPYLGRGTITGSVIDASGDPAPNAQVKLWARSVFGVETRTIAAGQDGTFVFDDIFIGTFSVTAEDTATHMAAKEDGTLDSHGQTVDLALQLGAWASLEGTVYRPDGTTTVSGASVFVGDISTTTDTNGQYRFEVLPLGTYSVTATDLGTRGVGRDTVMLDTLAETGQLDIVFAPQATLVVTVEDADGTPVEGATVTCRDSAPSYVSPTQQDRWKISAATDDNGIAVIRNVVAGWYEIRARKGVQTGDAEGDIAADDVLPVTIRLTPVGTIQGTVYEPDGVTPAQNPVQIVLLWGFHQSQYVVTNENGEYAFEGIPINDPVGNPFIYDLRAYEGGQMEPDGSYSGGQLRAAADDIVLETNGQVITRDLTLIGLGTVTGRVLMPDSSSASDMPVTLESHTPVFGRTWSTTTNAFGEYTIERVPVGDFTVTGGKADLQLLGEAEGAITSHLEEVTRDIILQTSAITLPEDLYDGNIFRYDLQPDGSIRIGRNLFDYNAEGGCRLEIISGGTSYTFPDTGVATEENAGREVAVKATDLGGINVTRKIFVPRDAYFARYLEILSNTSSDDVTIGVRLTSDFYSYYESYSHPHETAAIVTTSNGDAQIQVGSGGEDLWVVLDDSNTEDPFIDTYHNLPPAAFVWAGPGAGLYPGTAALTPYDSDTSSAAELSVEWTGVTVPAGESVAIMHFVVQHGNREAARACSERLVQMPPEALSGLSLSEIARVKNFDIPADGSSLLLPLPPITEGTQISGKVRISDGVTPPHYSNTRVYLQSDSIYFSRIYQSGYPDTEGNFSFVSDTTVNYGTSTRIPLTDFRLWAGYTAPQNGYGYTTLYSPEFAGTFAPGSTSATRDITFTNTGILQGTVRTDTGDPVENADVRIRYSGQSYSIWVHTDDAGAFFVPLVLPGEYTVQTAVSPPAGSQGDSITIDSPTQTVTAGETTDVPISLPPLGSIAGTIYSHEGTPVENVQVAVRGTETSFYRRTFTDAGGAYQLSELPVGDYVLTAYDPDTGAPTTASVHVAAQETSPTDITLPYTVDLPVELIDGNGFRWDIQTDGRIRYGTDNAYYYYSYGGLDLDSISLPDGYSDDFNGASDAIAEDDGRELLIGPHVFSGRDLEVSRKIFVPQDDAFARYLEILENTGTSDMTVSIHIRTFLGSGTDTEVVRTSGGDTGFSADDDYIITDDADGTGTPTLAHVFSGRYAEVEPASVETTQTSFNYRIGYTFDVTIPAGERRIIMHFASQNADRAHALTSADGLYCLKGRALAGLTPEEQADIVNFTAYTDTDCDGLTDTEETALGTDPDDPDTDGDGLTDRFERDYSFNPLVAGEASGDPDNDGLTNLQEQEHGTNPNQADTDADGLNDGDEISHGADPNLADTDNDGLTDGEEVHTWGSDPTLIDSDGDGLLDGFEAANGFDPSTAGEADDDADTDGLTNLQEQEHGTGPQNPDTDNDGLNDGDEVLTWHTDPLDPDTDDDGLIDGFETIYGMNPLTTGDETADPDNDNLNNLGEQTAGTNPLEPDSDGDGLLDGFEAQYHFDPLATGDETGDPDNDSLNNLEEQTLGTDPTQQDSDGDMLNDGDEVHTYHTNPLNWDTDMDQIGDGDEINGTNGYVTDPANPDTDGGGRRDGEEIWTDHTDPTDPTDDQVPVPVTEGEGTADHSAVAVDSTGNIHVVWQDNRTGNYQIYYAMLSPDKSTLINDTRLTNTATPAVRPALAVDNFDVVHVLWQDAGASSDEIYHMAVNPSLDDRNGTAATVGDITVVAAHLVSTDDGAASTDPRVSVDGQGRLHIVWGDDTAGQVRYTRMGADGTVQISDQVVFDAGSALTWGRALPTVAVDSNDDVHIAWMDRPSTSIEIFYAMLNGRSPDGGAADVLIDTTALTPSDGHDTRYPSIGIGPGNEVTLVYDSATRIPFWGSYVDGCIVAMLRIDPALDDQSGDAAVVGSITTLAETIITSQTFATTLPPSAMTDANGNVYVCYYNSYSGTGTPPRGSLSFTVLNSTGTPITGTRYLTDGTTATTTEELTLPSIAVNAGTLPGTSFVTWTDNPSGNHQILLRIIEP